MRTLYDSITPTDIPLTAAMVAGYVDGPYAWSPAGWARFPRAVHVRIATRASTNDGHVLDVEPGDATPAQAVAWVLMRRVAGADPTVYCGAASWPSVRTAFAAAHVAEPHYWIAHYDGDPTIPAGAVGKQYIDPPNSGGHWDLSVVADHWPGVDPTPKPPAPEVPDMQLTDKLPDPKAVAGTGTVQEALTTVLHGIGGVRNAGNLALAVSTQAAAIATLTQAVAAQHGLTIADIQAVFDTELAKTINVHVDVTGPNGA